MTRRYHCSNCEAEGEPGDAYCVECGWDGLIFALPEKDDDDADD